MPASVTSIPLSSGRRLATLRGTLEEVLARADEVSGAYVKVELAEQLLEVRSAEVDGASAHLDLGRAGFDRVVVSQEPHAMIKEKPCPCASLIYRNWHVVASTWTWPGGPLVSLFPTPQAIAKLRVYDFHKNPREEGVSWTFLPDLHLRWLHYDAITRLMEVDGAIHARITADDDASRRLDPETLEHLRGLGYVN